MNLTPNTGTSTSGGFYSYDTSSTDKDRALGSICASNNTACAIGVVLTNNTISTLTAFTVTYTGEQWRTSTNSSALPNTYIFQYAIGNAADLADLTSPTSFVTEPALNFTVPTVTVNGTSTNIDGNVVVIRATKTFTINGITWKVGDRLVLRWDDVTNGKSNNGMAIDDFSFQAKK